MKTNVLNAISVASRTMGELYGMSQYEMLDAKCKLLIEDINKNLQLIITVLEEFMTLECYRCGSTHQLNIEEKRDPETGCLLDKYYVCVRCSDQIRITNECKIKIT